MNPIEQTRAELLEIQSAMFWSLAEILVSKNLISWRELASAVAAKQTKSGAVGVVLDVLAETLRDVADGKIEPSRQPPSLTVIDGGKTD
jgi:hypothetical protein